MSLRLVLPKGRIFAKVSELLAECGLHMYGAERSYRPACSQPDIEVKLLKSQNIPPLLALGQHDIGFAGFDWIAEQNAHVEQLLDLQFDPVRIVAAIPDEQSIEQLKARKIIVVSEYQALSTRFLQREGYDFTFVRSYGATEVFPPEDADMIIDNTATGATLAANRLRVIATVLDSTTRFIANPQSLTDAGKRAQIENLLVLMQGVLQGRNRVLLEMNCAPEKLDAVVAMLPAMRSPTVAQLFNANGFSIKAAIPRSEVPALIPRLLAAGAADILELPIRKVI